MQGEKLEGMFLFVCMSVFKFPLGFNNQVIEEVFPKQEVTVLKKRERQKKRKRMAGAEWKKSEPTRRVGRKREAK